MQEVESLDVPAHGSSCWSSGGNHLMFEKLKQQAEAGREGHRRAALRRVRPRQVELPVKPATYSPKTGH